MGYSRMFVFCTFFIIFSICLLCLVVSLIIHKYKVNIKFYIQILGIITFKCEFSQQNEKKNKK